MSINLKYNTINAEEIDKGTYKEIEDINVKERLTNIADTYLLINNKYYGYETVELSNIYLIIFKSKVDYAFDSIDTIPDDETENMLYVVTKDFSIQYFNVVVLHYFEDKIALRIHDIKYNTIIDKKLVIVDRKTFNKLEEYELRNERNLPNFGPYVTLDIQFDIRNIHGEIIGRLDDEYVNVYNNIYFSNVKNTIIEFNNDVDKHIIRQEKIKVPENKIKIFGISQILYVKNNLEPVLLIYCKLTGNIYAYKFKTKTLHKTKLVVRTLNFNEVKDIVNQCLQTTDEECKYYIERFNFKSREDLMNIQQKQADDLLKEISKNKLNHLGLSKIGDKFCVCSIEQLISNYQSKNYNSTYTNGINMYFNDFDALLDMNTKGILIITTAFKSKLHDYRTKLREEVIGLPDKYKNEPYIEIMDSISQQELCKIERLRYKKQ